LPASVTPTSARKHHQKGSSQKPFHIRHDDP